MESQGSWTWEMTLNTLQKKPSIFQHRVLKYVSSAENHPPDRPNDSHRHVALTYHHRVSEKFVRSTLDSSLDSYRLAGYNSTQEGDESTSYEISMPEALQEKRKTTDRRLSLPSKRRR